MNRKEAYEEIVDAFEKKYSFLGKQFAEEFLMSLASWNIQEYTKPDFRIRRHPLLFWKAGWFKTIQHTKRVLTSSGYVPLKDLPDVGDLITLKEGQQILTGYSKSPLYNKECLSLETKFDYKIEVGVEHPFQVVKNNGDIEWVKTQDLVEDDVLVMAKPIIPDTDAESNEINCETARLIGYLIGDGCYSGKHAISFTKSISTIREDVKKLMKKYVTKKEPRSYTKGETIQLAWGSVEGRRKLESMGLKYVKSRHKTIPKDFIINNKKVLENLLFGLYQTDGSIRSNGLNFCSTSIELRNQIRDILLLLGVNCTFNNYYHLYVTGYRNLQRLPLIVNKSKHSARLKQIMKRRNNATEVIPNGSQLILSKLKKRKESIREQFKKAKISREGFYSSKSKNKDFFKKICKKLKLTELLWLTSEDIFFDEVKKTTKIGKQKCYDLFVPETNTFISEGFYTHNSSLLKKAYEILGPDLCMIMSDVTLAALRGTVDNRQFVAPFTLKRPFAISTEFGQVAAGDTELNQKLLNVLEEGIVNVTLAKISSIDAIEREKAIENYGVRFDDVNSFTYTTNWVLMAGTYDSKFLVDSAFKSRFATIVPDKKLDSTLIKHVYNASGFVLSEDATSTLRRQIKYDEPVESFPKIPDEVYDFDLSPREVTSVLSNVMTKKWWGLETSKDDMVALAEKYKKISENIWKSADDKVFDALDPAPKNVAEIVEVTDLSKRQVFKSLKSLRATKIFDEEGVIKYKLF